MPTDRAEILRVREQARCLYTTAEVGAALDRVAVEVHERLAGVDPLMLCVMKGGAVICGQLLPRLDFPLQLDYVQVSRYRDETRGGALEWRVRPQQEIAGRTLLIVDDILDEGHTLDAIITECRAAGADDVLSVVLVDKRHDRKCRAGFRADFTALETDDSYLFGYGMDYKGYLRNAPGIFAVEGGATP